MLKGALFLILLVSTCQALAGERIKYSCPNCHYSTTLFLGEGMLSKGHSYPFICTNNGKKTIVAVERTSLPKASVKTNDCNQGMILLKFQPGMKCPVCPGDVLHSEYLGQWD